MPKKTDHVSPFNMPIITPSRNRLPLSKPSPQPAPPPTEKKIVFDSGATRCDIGRAEYYLIAPCAFERIAITARHDEIMPLQPIEHVNEAVGRVGSFLALGLMDDGTPFTYDLELAALHVMYAIDPDFKPLVNVFSQSRGHGPAYHMLPGKAVTAVANAWGEGKIKYAAYNWEKGMPADVIFNHFYDHAFKYFGGNTEEDHLGHMLWNLITANHSLHEWDKLNRGKFRIAGEPPTE